MSDDLVKRLRDLGDHAAFEPHMHHTAADRIEELESKLDLSEGALGVALRSWRECQSILEQTEDKLTKAVEALEHAKLNMPHPDQMIDDALAELKGKTDA